MLKKLLFNIRWRLFQKLSLLPSSEDAAISDLFLWRVDENWGTYFDLVSIPNLINHNSESVLSCATIHIFNSTGNHILKKRIELSGTRRVLLDIKDLLGKEDNSYGTFCIFHDTACDGLRAFKSHIAERGYLSFSYQKSNIRSYVHGNFDAVALVEGKKIEFLGNQFIWNRKYNLQCILNLEKKYEVILIGTCAKPIKYEIQLFDIESGILLDKKEIKLAPAEVFIYKSPKKSLKYARVIITSHSIMARPIVLNYQNRGVNIFHG